MENKIGFMLKELRESKARTVQNTARGIISPAELSRLESGRKETEYLLLEALFETLGTCIDKLEVTITQDEYELLETRKQIETALEKKETHEAEVQIALYEKRADCGKAFHLQYLKTVQALNEEIKTGNRQKALDKLEYALGLTMEGKSQDEIYPFHQEIYLIYLISYFQWELGQQKACETIRKLEKYISTFYKDGETKVKIYPQCVWLLGKMLYTEGKYKESYYFAQNGIECLRENGSLQWLEELFRLKKECAGKLSLREEEQECATYLDAASFLYKEIGIQKTDFSVVRFLQSSTQRDCVVCNQFLKDLRETAQITQEELCEDICAWETISRVERGRNPNKKKFYKMLKRLGVERERYYGFIESAHYADYEKVRNYNRLVGRKRMEDAERLLYQLKSDLDLSLTLNKQFIGTSEIMLSVKKKELPEKKAIDSLWELLYLTMPPKAAEEKIYRLPFRTEFFILNQIARCYARIGQKDRSVEIYGKILEQYKKNGIDMRYHVVPGIVLYVNYAAYLEDEDKLETAEIIAKEGLRFAVSCQRGDTAGKILGNVSCVYGKRNQTEREKAYLIHAYYLTKLYRQDVLSGILKEAYGQKFGEG